jgi:hypothetical protein
MGQKVHPGGEAARARCGSAAPRTGARGPGEPGGSPGVALFNAEEADS